MRVIILETERLVLRRLHAGDAPFMLELMNEPGWLQFIGDRGVRTLDDARAYIERSVVAMHERHGFSLSCVTLRGDATPVGLCGLVKRDGLDDPDLGFAFLSRWCGPGFAREAALGVMAHARAVLRLARVVAVTSPDNARSIHLLESIGFHREGSVQLAAGKPEVVLFGVGGELLSPP